MYSKLFSLLACLGLVSSAPITTIVGRSEAGPVDTNNFPDPCIINYDNTWYSFATRTIGSAVHIQVAKSTDFAHWVAVTNSDGSEYDALPTLGAWVNQTNWNTWAPDVSELDDGSFIMYYSATTNKDKSGLYHCTGAATSKTGVLGPYIPQANSLFCPLSQGGAIDPDGFKDPATNDRYIVYKVDGNSKGMPTPLILQQVEANGYTFVGNPTTLMTDAGASDNGVVEAPSLARFSTGTYVLFFSSGTFTQDTYTVSYATAPSVTGPYTRQPNPLFKTGTDGLTAPGSCDIWSDSQHMVFHANHGSGRSLYTATVSINGDTISSK